MNLQKYQSCITEGAVICETKSSEIMCELSVRKAQWYVRPGLEKCVSYLCKAQWCVRPELQQYVSYLPARRSDT